MTNDFPELGRLREAVLGFGESRDLASFWDLVCAKSRLLIPSRRVCAILLSDFELLYLQAAREGDDTPGDIAREFPAGNGDLYKAMRSGRPAWLLDSAEDASSGNGSDNDGSRNELEQWLYKDDPPLLLVLPVADREHVIGSLIFATELVPPEPRARLESAGELYALHVGTVYSLLSARAGLEVSNRLASIRNDQLEESRGRLREMNRELEEADKLKQEFLANMSHELRTPLNSIIGFSDLLGRNREENLTEKNLSHVEKINRNGKYLLQMINNLLDISHLQAGEVEFDIQDVPIREALEQAVQIMEPVARQKGIVLEWTAVDAQLTARCDPERLKQVLTTLISNAVKFVERKTGRVQIVAGGTPDGARITVSDNGVGISEDKQSVIMEPFRQADGSSTRDHGGLGLGLSIARKLTEAMGGELQVESTPGSGSRFTLIL